jgi:hypothetical protein
VEESVQKGEFVIMHEDGHFLLGEILNFRFLNEKSQRLKRFSRKSCFVKCLDEIGLSANWYLITEIGSLIQVSISHYIDIKNYMFHVQKHAFDLEKLEIKKDVVDILFW